MTPTLEEIKAAREALDNLKTKRETIGWLHDKDFAQFMINNLSAIDFALRFTEKMMEPS